MKNENAWALMLAIFIASIGLNVNSTAVIIGAMLISPLMGPIVGGGYALAIDDLDLLKLSIRNFAFAITISLITSTIYFFISPFTIAQSEILARTEPTIFDILIAFCGGLVGIVALSRKEKGNAIPGVAIATALMPPLCTVGFGISKFNFKYALGAGYLFLSNVLFIGIATYFVVKLLSFNQHINKPLRSMKNTRFRIYFGIFILIFILPGLWSAWYVKAEREFVAKIEQFIKTELNSKNIFITKRIFEYKLDRPIVKLYAMGNLSNDEYKNNIFPLLKQYHLENVDFEIIDLLSTSKQNKQVILDGKNEIEKLKAITSYLNSEMTKIKDEKRIEFELKKELFLNVSSLTNVLVHEDDSHIKHIYFMSKKKFSHADMKKIENISNKFGKYTFHYD